MQINQKSSTGIFQLNLSTYSREVQRIIIFDQNGNQIETISHPSKEMQLDLSTKSTGFYHLSIVFEELIEPVKLLLFRE